MKCFFHPYKQAVAQCVDCHRALCSECAGKYKIPICDRCNNRRIRSDLLRYIKPLIICILLYILGYNIEIFSPDKEMGGYMCMASYGGWKFINKFCPFIFLWFSIKALLGYFLIKLCLSMFIGFFTTPIYLTYCLYNIVQLIILKKTT